MELSRLSKWHVNTALLLLCTPLLAAAAEPPFHAQQLELILGFSNASHSFSHLHLGSGATEEKDTLHSTSNNNDFTWGVAYAYNILPWFVSYQHSRDNDILKHVLVGLDWIFLNTTDSGEVYQYGISSMDNFNYDFDVKTSRIMVNTEVDFNFPLKNMFPYVQASVGGARVVTHYHDYPTIASMGGGVELGDETNYNLTYSLGVGLKYLVTSHFQVSASYLYTDFGVIKSEDEALTDRFWTSSGLVGLTYLFG